jgi:hypothetical protein
MLKTTNKTIKPLANHEMQTEWGVEKRNINEEQRKNRRVGRVLYYNVSNGTLNNIFFGVGIKFYR